jgi:hypothetical protein
LPGGIEITVNHAGLSPDWELNPGPAEYKTGLSVTASCDSDQHYIRILLIQTESEDVQGESYKM